MKISEPHVCSLPMIQNYSFTMLKSKECVLLPIEIRTEFFSLAAHDTDTKYFQELPLYK